MRRTRVGGGLRGATPLIDLLFLLLFGLLALSDTRTSTREETVRIRLPRVEPGERTEASEAKTFVIEIDADSKVRLDKYPGLVSGPADLDAALASRMGDTLPEEYTVEIRGDVNARYGVAVELLQHLRRRGFAGVNLLAFGSRNATWTTKRPR